MINGTVSRSITFGALGLIFLIIVGSFVMQYVNPDYHLSEQMKYVLTSLVAFLFGTTVAPPNMEKKDKYYVDEKNNVYGERQ